MRDRGGRPCDNAVAGAREVAARSWASGASREHVGHRNASIGYLVGTIVKRHLKHALELLFVPIAAAIVFFEEVLLHYLGVAMAALARLAAGCPPGGVAGGTAAVGRAGRLRCPLDPGAAGEAGGRLVRLARPVRPRVATSSSARSSPLLWLRGFTRCCGRPWCRSWFLGAETWLFAWRDRIYGFVRALPLWQRTKALVRRAKVWLAELVSGLRPYASGVEKSADWTSCAKGRETAKTRASSGLSWGIHKCSLMTLSSVAGAYAVTSPIRFPGR